MSRGYRPSHGSPPDTIRPGRLSEPGTTHGPRRRENLEECMIGGCTTKPGKYAPLCAKHYRYFWIGKGKNR